MLGHLILGLALLITSFELSPDAAVQQAPAPKDGRGKSSSSPPPVAPEPNPDATGKYHIGDGVSPPKLRSAADPEYTDAARHKRLQGKVVLLLTVDIDGKAQNVRVSHSLSETVSKKLQTAARSLDRAAMQAAQQYRFDPALFQGKPVPVETTVEIDYRLY